MPYASLLTSRSLLFTFPFLLFTPSRLPGLSGYGRGRPNPTYATLHSPLSTSHPFSLLTFHSSRMTGMDDERGVGMHLSGDGRGRPHPTYEAS